jgi:tetratricopeptide (TPR) repeat protein
MIELENYLAKAQQITQESPESEQIEEMSSLINDQEWANDSLPYQELFKGERSFYQGLYEKAVQYYLEAKEIPQSRFLCYRALAFLLNQHGQSQQAIDYIKKALIIEAEDPISLKLLVSLEQNSASHEQSLELSMNSGSDIFSSTSSAETESGISLKQRLYPVNDTPVPAGEDYQPSSDNDLHALNELRRLAKADEVRPHLRSTMAREHDNTQELEQRLQAYQQKHAQQMYEYLINTKKRNPILNNNLCILHGWDSKETPPHFAFFTEESRHSHGGHFLTWNGKGIVLNPGPGFIHNFHQQGLSIRDIDFVIVTRNHPDAYEDVRAIYELSSQLNKTAAEMQIIHYYLQHQAHRQLLTVLKPNSKQAKHTIHSLEMFSDSPDVETIDLNEEISLNYFLSTTPEQFQNHRRGHEALTGHNKSALGIRLDLNSDTESVQIGYLTGMGWSPLLAHHLGNCDILILGFGHTNPADYSKIGYNEDSLGFHGCYSLLQEVAPSLLLLSEFQGRDGDIRLEVVKKIRSDFCCEELRRHTKGTTILPTDIGLTIDLQTCSAQCTMTGTNVLPAELTVVTSASDFGRLRYLSPTFCL